MKCPACPYPKTVVLETRGPTRRRECPKCGNRFNTRERTDAELEALVRAVSRAHESLDTVRTMLKLRG